MSPHAAPTARPESQSREAWAGDSPLRSAARDRLLDATARCIVRDGLTNTGVAAVASEAGVSRPTVYRYFADRHALVLATMLREGGALAAKTATHLQSFPDAATKAVEAELYVIARVPEDPLLAEAWNSTVLDASMLAEFTRPPIIAVARQALRGLEEAAGWDDTAAVEASEWMLRLLLSLLLTPAPDRSEDELRELLWRRLVPALGLTDSTKNR